MLRDQVRSQIKLKISKWRSRSCSSLWGGRRQKTVLNLPKLAEKQNHTTMGNNIILLKIFQRRQGYKLHPEVFPIREYTDRFTWLALLFYFFWKCRRPYNHENVTQLSCVLFFSVQHASLGEQDIVGQQQTGCSSSWMWVNSWVNGGSLLSWFGKKTA